MWDGEWLLEYAGASCSIGGTDPADPFKRPRQVHLREAPVIGDVAVTTDDNLRARRDGVDFGADFRGGRTIRLEVAVEASSEADVLQLVAELETDWRADTIRRVPGAMATLSTRNGGRERMVYGRPRRLQQTGARRKSAFKVAVTCEFDTTDDVFYSRLQVAAVVPFAPATSGTFSAPLVAPISTVPHQTTQGAIYVSSDLPVWPVATIQGPITNPVLELVNEWQVQLLEAIPAGMSVTIDSRPWRCTVLRSDGASLAGALRFKGWDRMAVKPGPHVLALGGIDNTGLSGLTFAWQNTFASI